MRETSPVLEEFLIKGLTECGADVFQVGLVSTPAYYFSVGHLEAQGGLMVTASHNPAQYNGFKVVRAKAVPLGGESGFEQMRDIMEQETFLVTEKQGIVTQIEAIPEKAAEAEITYAGDALIKKFKIIVDSGNGMGAQYLDALFEKINVDVTRMYWDMDGTFPNHESNPMKEETLIEMKKRLIEEQADLGIATDGDGDRIFFIDNTGKTVEPAIIRGMLAQVMLRRFPGSTICYDVRPGKITKDLIEEAGGKPSLTKVGHSLIKAQMREVGAMFGGESSGHFFYRYPTGIYEGPVTAIIQILQELTASGKTFSELTAPYYRYFHSGEINYVVEDKEATLARIRVAYADADLMELDGLTVTYPTYWFNVRPSNTESLLRFTLEAVDQATMEQQRDEVIHLIQ